MLDFVAISQQCAPQVAHETMARLVRVESGFNPFAIGVVNGHLERQPKNLDDAVATAQQLEKDGWNFSVGLAQINISNLKKYNVSYENAFDLCRSLSMGGKILKECYDRAKLTRKDDQDALAASLSCFYSGNFKTGFKPDFKGQPSYVQKVLAAAGVAIPAVRDAKSSAASSTPKTSTVPAPATTAATASDVPASLPVDLIGVLEKGPVKKKRGGMPSQYNGFAKDQESEARDGFGLTPDSEEQEDE